MSSFHPRRDDSAPGLEKEADAVFRESAELIREFLAGRDRIDEQSATSLQEALRGFFQRFCWRAGAPAPREARHTLLLMACVFGRGYQRYAVETGGRALDARLDRVLARDPAEVAREVSKGLKLLYRELHGK